MVIDAHQHWTPDPVNPIVTNFIAYMYKCMKCPPISLEKIEKEYCYLADDPYGERMVEHMDISGVDKSVVFCWDREAYPEERIMEAKPEGRRDRKTVPRPDHSLCQRKPHPEKRA